MLGGLGVRQRFDGDGKGDVGWLRRGLEDRMGREGMEGTYMTE